MIWNHISSLGYPVKNPIVVLNCRPDRVDRTIQYSEDVLPNMEIGTLIVLGQSTKPIKEAFDKGKIKAESYKNYEGIPTIEAFRHIEDNLSDRVIFCVGNIHGAGEEFIELVTDYANNLLNSTLLQ
jgi:hypothetical protein